MFRHQTELQYKVKVNGPDPAMARRFSEVLGGKWGEMTVAMQYLYQGWNTRLPGKYRDMLLDIGTEELGHVEMIVSAIDQLLTGAPIAVDERDLTKGAAATNAHTNPQHLIVNGGGAYPHDSNGVPWSGAFVTSSGNLMADFYLNATAEMQGRLQVARLFHMTDDNGLQDLMRFLLTRDHMHQMQWLAAIEELKEDGLDGLPVPEAFPLGEEFKEFDRVFLQGSDQPDSAEGRWASGPAPDGRGDFRAAPLEAQGGDPLVAPGDPRLYATQQVGKAQQLIDKVKGAMS